jgi:membrane protein YqaA with SNARE-associated domain
VKDGGARRRLGLLGAGRSAASWRSSALRLGKSCSLPRSQVPSLCRRRPCARGGRHGRNPCDLLEGLLSERSGTEEGREGWPATPVAARVGWLRRLYDWTMTQAAGPHALWILALVAFVESSLFPIPPDVLLIPMVLAARRRAWLIAAVCTVSSVAGGMLGYAIGALLFEAIGRPILEFYGYLAQFADFQARYNEWGAWIVFGAGVTPFPYKVITIASGVTQLDLVVFTVASVLARGLRFFFVAALLWYFGEPIRRFIERNLGWLTILFFVLLFGGFLALRLL